MSKVESMNAVQSKLNTNLNKIDEPQLTQTIPTKVLSSKI